MRRAASDYLSRLWRTLCLSLYVSVLVLVISCGGAQTETPNATTDATLSPTRPPLVIPTPPPGWTPYSRSTFQIALPNSWQEIKLSDTDLKNAITTAQGNNPPLAEQLRTLLDTGQYKAFLLYAVEKKPGVLENVSVARVTLEGGTDLQAYAKAYANALPDVVRGAKLIDAQMPLRVNGMNAAAFTYDVSLVDGAGNLTTLRGVQYLYVLDSGDAYLITVTGQSDDAAKFTALARQIGTSFVGVTP